VEGVQGASRLKPESAMRGEAGVAGVSGGMTLAVVIASREEHPPSAECAAAAGLPFVVVVGRDPARQRNEGARKMAAEVLWFVDDDTEFTAEVAERGVEWFRDERVVGVGGPCPAPPTLQMSAEQGAVYAAMTSWLAYGPSRARYTPVGLAREADESLLIGSNLMVRASAFREVGGFPERLFPNEENLLMDRLAERGRLIYDPELAAYRKPPQTLAEYFEKVRKYGGGRWQQYERDRSWRNGFKVLVGLGSVGMWVWFPWTAVWRGWVVARAIHGTHLAYAAGLWRWMSGGGIGRG